MEGGGVDGPAARGGKMAVVRADGRDADALRPVSIERGYLKHAEGSVRVCCGDTIVVCSVSVEFGVPSFLRGSGQGWLTAEYGMLPRATHTRNPREAARGRQGGRTMEIQRLIGRALRSVLRMDALGERTLWIDCDVLQADGGTRTAAISGAFVAVVDALTSLYARGDLSHLPVTDFLAAVSVGIVDGTPVLDLAYAEDSRAEVDMNLVGTGAGRLVEVQGTAERAPFELDQFYELVALGRSGIEQLVRAQRAALGERAAAVGMPRPPAGPRRGG